MKLDFIKYLSVGYYAEKNSKEGLNLLREFNKKVNLAGNKKELENLVQEYGKKVNTLERKYLASWIPSISTILPGILINNVYISMSYVLVASSVQLADWTRRIIRFKTEEGLCYETWDSRYPYEKKFDEKVKALLEGSF